MKRFAISIISAITFCAGYAVTVETMPGMLAQTLEGTDLSDHTLTLTGMIGPDDFKILRELEGVDALDMSALKLTASPMRPGLIYDSNWPESTFLPAYALFASPYSEIRLPSSLTEIREGALTGTKIQTLVVPENVRSIGAYAFYGAEALTSVMLPEALTSLGNSAFDGCRSLEYFNLAETQVHVLPDRCLAGTSSLEELDASYITELGREALFASGLKTLKLPAVRSVGPFALAEMPRLRSLSMREGAVIAKGAVMGNSLLTDMTGVPEAVPEVFAAGCSAYSPDGVMEKTVSVGDFAFANTMPQNILLISGLTRIGAHAFTGCTTLTEIDASQLAGYMPEVETDAFAGIITEDVLLIVADGCEDIWKTHPVWGRFNVISARYVAVEEVDTDAGAMQLAVNAEGIKAASPYPGITIEIFTLDGRKLLHFEDEGNEAFIGRDMVPSGALVVRAASEGNSKTLKIIL